MNCSSTTLLVSKFLKQFQELVDELPVGTLVRITARNNPFYNEIGMIISHGNILGYLTILVETQKCEMYIFGIEPLVFDNG